MLQGFRLWLGPDQEGVLLAAVVGFHAALLLPLLAAALGGRHHARHKLGHLLDSERWVQNLRKTAISSVMLRVTMLSIQY